MTPLTSFAEGVWIDTAPVRIIGMRLTATMAVLRLGDGGLLLYSPIAMSPERRAAVEALGPVAHLYAPSGRPRSPRHGCTRRRAWRGSGRTCGSIGSTAPRRSRP
jgi:hypothetical protein